MDLQIPFMMFGSALGFLLVSVTLIILLFIFDNNEVGWAGFISFIVFGIVNHFWGNFPLLELFTWKNIFAYVLIGFLFALIRTYFKGQELKRKSMPKNVLLSESASRTYDYRKNFELKDNVFRWWFMWPISFLSWVFTDIVRDIYNFIYSKVEILFTKVFNV